MASTSAFEIGFAAAEPAGVSADGAEALGAVAVDGEGGAEAPFAGPADGDGCRGTGRCRYAGSMFGAKNG
jgi:hypothetical protein